MSKMIYHYTSIAALRQILESRSLRLSRLDSVDDPEEWTEAANGINPAKYVYVSSWTREQREMIPQWKMYGGFCHGVRIGMPEDCLATTTSGTFTKYYKLKDCNPYPQYKLSSGTKSFLRDMIYVKDPLKKIHEEFGRHSITTLCKNWDNELINMNEKITCYKNDVWAFQKECRFSVAAFPEVQGARSHPRYILVDGVAPSDPWINVRIKDEALASMEILLGPCVTTDEEAEAMAAMNSYLHRNDIGKSKFSGVMRDWGYLGPTKYYIFTNEWREEIVLKLITVGHEQGSMRNMAVLQQLTPNGEVIIVPLIELECNDKYRLSTAGEAKIIARRFN